MPDATISSYTPGQNLHCTIDKLPRTADAVATIARLMRMDPVNKRALRRAQRMRRQRMVVYNRGNRDWTSREICARIVRVEVGKTWTMRFDFNIAPDLAAVAQHLKIEVA